MPDVLYRSILDASDVLAKISLIESRLVGLGQRSAVNLRINDAAANASLTSIENRLKRLGTGTQRITLRLGSSSSTVDPMLAQLQNIERQARSLGLATGQTLGMTQRLGGIFGFMPGPIGLYASAASMLSGSLATLNAAQKLNTIGAFALVGGLVAIGAAIGSLASHGIKQLGEFQSAVNTLNAQGDGLGDGFDARIRQLQESGGRVAQQFNRAELGVGAADLTKQGLAEADAMKVLATSYRLAGAEGAKLQESSTLLLSNLRQFGLDGPKAAEEAAHFGDVLAKGSLQAASGAKELQIGLSVVGPAAHSMGLSLEETVGYLVAMDNAGLKASTIGANAFRAVLLALASPTGVARQEIDKLGVALKNADGSARPVRDVLIDLRRAAKISGQGYDDATKAAIRSADTVSSVASIFRSRGVVGFLNMTDAVDKYTTELNASGGALDQYANALTEGPAKAQERLRKSVDDLALTLAQTFGPKLSQGLDNVTKFFRDIDELTQRPEAVKAYLNAIATGIGGITVALTLNTLASSGALGAGGLAAFIRMVEGTVAGGALVKAATYIKNLALTASVAYNFGGFSGLVTTLMAIPAVAGAALAATTLFASGAIAANFKLAGDIHQIYAQIDADADKHTRDLMTRVAELRKQGPLGQLKAQQALNIDLRYNYENSAEKNAELDALLLKLKQQIKAEEEHQAALLASQKAKRQDVMATEEQNTAYASLGDRLDELSARFGEVKTTTFQKNLADARKALEDFKAEVDKQESKGELTPIQAGALKKRADAAQPTIVASLTQRQMDEDKKAVAAHQREIEDARLAIVKDAALKRQGEYKKEIADLNSKYGPQIQEALRNAQAKGLSSSQKRGFLDTAGTLQKEQAQAQAAALAKLNVDLAELEKDRAKKVRDASTQNLVAYTAEMEGRTSIFQTEYKRAQDLAGEDVARRLRVEQTYAPQLEALQRSARIAKAQADRQALRNQLQDELAAAENQGEQTAQLKIAANNRYLTSSRILEASYAADIKSYQLAAIQSVQQARADATKQQLDLELKSVEEWTGTQLSSFERVLKAKAEVAFASGDAPLFKTLSDAIKKIEDQKFENFSNFKKDVKESSVALSELRTKLADLNPNKDPRQEALSKAANPYNSLIADAKKQQQALQEAYAKLTPDQQRDQGGAYLRQQRQLSALLLDVGRQRNVALQVADAEFNRKRENEAQQSALKLAKTEYDRTRDSGAYLLALDQDKAFWQARLKLAKEGSQQQQEAEQRLSENEGVRKAVLESDKQLIEQRRQMSRDELQSALDLARTDADRARARAQLLQVDRDRLAALPAEIAASEKTVGNEDKTNALKREQLTLRKSLLQAADEEVQRSDELLSSQLKLQVAQHALVAARAVTNAQVVSAKQQSIADTQAEADQIARLLDTAEQRGLTALQIDDKKVELLGKQTSIYQQQVALHDYLKSLGQESLALLESQIKLQNTLTGGINDPEQAKQSEIESVRRQLALNAANIQNAKNQEEVNQLQIERNGLLADEIVKQRELAALSLQRRQSEVALQEARGKLNLQLNGMANDAVSMARADLDISRNKFQLTQSELKLAQQRGAGITEINGLLARQAEEQAEILKNVQKLAEAEKSRIELAEQLAQAHIRVMRAIRGQGTDSGEISQRLELNLEQRIDAFNDSVEKSLGKIREAQKNIAKIARDKATFEANHPNFNYLNQWNEDTYSLVLSIRQDNRIFQEKLSLAVGELGKQVSEELRTKIRSNLAEQRQAEAQHIGTIVLPALQKELDARSALADATIKYGEAVVEFNRVPFNTDNAERLKSSTEALTSALEAHKASLKGLADGYRNAVTEMDGVRDASERLKKAAYQGNDPFQSAKELDRLTAIAARRDAAQARLREAIGSNDVARIKRATLDLAQQQERYNAQADKLEKNGVGITRDDNAATRQLSDQVDALGIQYDRDSINLDKRAEQLDREAETVTAFGSYVNEFQETVNRLVEQRGDRYVDGNWIKSADVEKYLDGLKIVNSQASVAYAAPNTQGATSQAVTAAAVQAAINASVNSAKQEAVKSPTAVSGGQTSTITNVFNFSIPVTVDGAPVPTPQEFRAIAQEVFQQGVGSAVRNKDWLGGHCDK